MGLTPHHRPVSLLILHLAYMLIRVNLFQDETANPLLDNVGECDVASGR